jgi:hypothetical protein
VTFQQTAADDTGGGGLAQFLFSPTVYSLRLPNLSGASIDEIKDNPANGNASAFYLPDYNGGGVTWMAGLSGANNKGSFTLGQITAPSATAVPTCTGSCTHTWTYVFVANDSYGSTTAGAAGTTTVGSGNLNGTTDYITMYPSTLPTGTVSLDVYRTAAGGTCGGSGCTQGKIGSLSGSSLQNPTGLSFVDTGMAGDGNSSPATNTTGKFNGINPTMLKTRQVGFMLGSDTGSALADTDDQAGIYVNRLGQGIHVTEVWCQSDAGTPSIQLQKDDGSPTNMLSSNLSCATGAGASTASFVSGEDAVADGDRINFVMVTAGGTAKRVTVYAKYTLD